jgi:hypothetical protein
LNIKIKGRGLMLIKVKYENVPYFCFTCGYMGHAAVNYEQHSLDHEVKYEEDLRASPLKCNNDIMINTGTLRIARSLFQGSDYGPTIVGSVGRSKTGTGATREGTTTPSNWEAVHGEEVEHDLATGVQDMHMHEEPATDSQEDPKKKNEGTSLFWYEYDHGGGIFGE